MAYASFPFIIPLKKFQYSYRITQLSWQRNLREFPLQRDFNLFSYFPQQNPTSDPSSLLRISVICSFLGILYELNHSMSTFVSLLCLEQCFHVQVCEVYIFSCRYMHMCMQLHMCICMQRPKALYQLFFSIPFQLIIFIEYILILATFCGHSKNYFFFDNLIVCH